MPQEGGARWVFSQSMPAPFERSNSARAGCHVWPVLGAFVAALSLTAACASAEPPIGSPPSAVQAFELSDAADDLVQAGVPGVVIRVIGPGLDETITSGVADQQSGESVTAATLFNLGGASNSYLAAAMLLQQESGAVALGQSVEEFLPGTFTYGWDIAIYDLLQHSSGIPDYVSVGDGRGTVIESCVSNGNCDWEPDQILDLVDQLDRDFQPGEGWGFSNTDYVVAALIAEQVDNMAWTDVLKRRIYDPLGLVDTFVPDDYASHERLARGYTDLDGDGRLDDVTALLPAGAGADGALVTSADDAMAFFRPLLRGDFLSPANQTALFAVAPTTFGAEEFGLGVSFIHGFDAGQIGHTGENLGHSVFVEHDLKTDITTVVFVNQSGDLPADAWGALLEAATGVPNRGVRSRESAGPGQLRLFCQLY